jgi:hypothetical protein
MSSLGSELPSQSYQNAALARTKALAQSKGIKKWAHVTSKWVTDNIHKIDTLLVDSPRPMRDLLKQRYENGTRDNSFAYVAPELQVSPKLEAAFKALADEINNGKSDNDKVRVDDLLTLDFRLQELIMAEPVMMFDILEAL